MPDIAVNRDGFYQFQRRLGIETERDLAKRMGMDAATVSRALSGKARPGRRFIAASLRLFGEGWFNALFKVID